MSREAGNAERAECKAECLQEWDLCTLHLQHRCQLRVRVPKAQKNE
jgi:hypothetical protein